MGIKSRTSYTFESGENSFPIPFEFIDGSEILEISEDGLKARLGVLAQDEWDQGNYFEDNDEGEFYQFDAHYINYTPRPEIDTFKRIVRENPGRVFTTSYAGDCHGPGTTRIYIESGPFTVKDTYDKKPCKMCGNFHPKGFSGDCRDNDSRFTLNYSEAETALYEAGGYYIVPEDAGDYQKYAESCLKEYSNWCNGDIYGVCVWEYERESIEDPWSEPDRDNECWGFIGYQYAKEELGSYFKKEVNEG